MEETLIKILAYTTVYTTLIGIPILIWVLILLIKDYIFVD
jgi:hypothetical protein